MTAGLATPAVFCCYSHEDTARLEAFERAIEPCLAAPDAQVHRWSDKDLVPGSRWDPGIRSAIDRAVGAFVLVSQNSLISPYINQVELPELVRRNVPIWWFPVEHCLFEDHWLLGGLHALHPPDQVLEAWLQENPEYRTRMWTTLARAGRDQIKTVLDSRRPSTDSTSPPAVRPTAPDPIHRYPAKPIPRGPSGAPVALGSSDPTAAPVPPLPPHMVPRTAWMDDAIDRLLSQAAGATGIVGARGIAGEGGMGKSVMAAAMARDPRVIEAFPDGICWITLGERPDVVGGLREILRRFGDEREITSVLEASEALRAVLVGHRVLLIVDDVWSRGDAAAFLVTDRSSRVLFTSRDGEVLTRVGVATAPLDRMTHAEAREFLSVQAGVASANELPAGADQMIEAVGSITLALTLIGARLRAGHDPNHLISVLRAGTDAYGDHPFANQFKAIAVTMDSLDLELRSRALELAVFPEDAEIPEEVLFPYWRHRGAASPKAVLRALVDAGLVHRVGENTVRFHDLVGDYLRLAVANPMMLHVEFVLAQRSALDEPTAGWNSLPTVPGYLRQWLLFHLAEAGMDRELGELVRDLRFLADQTTVLGPYSVAQQLTAIENRVPFTQVPRELVDTYLRLTDGLAGCTFEELLTTLGLWVARNSGRPVPAPASRFRASLPPRAVTAMSAHIGAVWSVGFDPSGARVVSGGADGKVRVWDLSSPDSPVVDMSAHNGMAWSVGFDPSGARVVSGGEDGKVRVWDLSSPDSPVVDMSAHNGTVWSVGFDPSGARVVSGGADGKVRVWDLSSPDSPVVDMSAHDGMVLSVGFDPSGARVVSGGADGKVRVWDLSSPDSPVVDMSAHDGMAWSVGFDPSGARVVSGGADGKVRVWDLSSPDSPVVDMSAHDGMAWSVGFDPSGARVVSGGADGKVRVWDLSSPDSPVVDMSAHNGAVWSVGFDPSGARVVSGGADGKVRVWDLSSPDSPVVDMSAHNGAVWSVGFDPSGARLVSGGEDGKVRVWDLSSPDSPVVDMSAHNGTVWSVGFDPSGARLVSGGEDGKVRVWDLSSPDSPVVDMSAHNGMAWSVGFDPSGARLVSGGQDGKVRVWDLSSPDSPVVDMSAHNGTVLSVGFDPSGARLVSGGQDGKVRVWDLSSPDSPVVDMSAHDGKVLSVGFDPSGARVVSGGQDGKVRVWDLSSPDSPVWGVVLASHVRSVAMTRNGPQTAVAAGVFREFVVFEFEPSELGLPEPGRDGRKCSIAEVW